MQHSQSNTLGERAIFRATMRSWDWLLAGLIASGALVIRAWSMRSGLPYLHHPDEPVPINLVVQMLRTGDLNPHFFLKPSLSVYVLLAILAPHYWLGLYSGRYTPLDQMVITTDLYTTIPEFFIWGRLATSIIGSLTVLSVFAIGKHICSPSAGLVAALFVAFLPFHMRHSQYVTTDVPTGWLVLLSFARAIMVAQEGRHHDYLTAGLFAGLAASTKYNAAVVVIPLIAAHAVHWRQQMLIQLPRLMVAGVVSVMAFILGTPYALLSWEEFRQEIMRQWNDYTINVHGDITGSWNIKGYTEFFLADGLELFGCLALILGLFFLLHRRRDIGVVWLSFALPYLILHLAQPSHFMRNLIPLIVLCALPIGIGCATAIEWLASRLDKAVAFPQTLLRYSIGSAVLLLFLLPASLELIQHSGRMLRGDTRNHALHWIETELPPGTRIAAELRPLPGPFESPWVEVDTLLKHDLSWYRRQGYAYMIGSSDVWRQWPIPNEYTQFAGQPPVAQFGGATAREMLGPHLAIYRTGLSSADVPERSLEKIKIEGSELLGIAIGRPLATAPQLGIEPTRSFKPGETLALRTFWLVTKPFAQDLFIFVHVLGANGTIIAQRDTPPWQGRFPTSSWRPGSIVVDVNNLQLPPDLPEGSYIIEIGMFDPTTGARPITSINNRLEQRGAAQLGTITIER